MLADNGIEGDEVPESNFLPDGTEWLDETEVSAALGSISGSTSAETPGIHGLGLISTNVNGTELVPESTTAVEAPKPPKSKSKSRTRANRRRTGSPSR